MKCKDCVLKVAEYDPCTEQRLGYGCRISGLEGYPYSDAGTREGGWLDRDCVRDDKRKAKLKEQMEA